MRVPGYAGEQVLIGRGGGGLAAEAVAGQAAVVVAAAGGRQAEIVSQGDEPGSFGIRLVGMEHLKAGQSYGGQLGDLLVRDPPPTSPAPFSAPMIGCTRPSTASVAPCRTPLSR